ncbi:MAG TPA: hypothetical protein VJ934_01985 [Desulfomicrobiaceae bacterium]|nr:hypothetical protein [Desulfomicrobiaceae bacterium]
MTAITPTHTVLDIVADHPETEPVFRSRDDRAGECILCNGLFETVTGLCSKYGLNQAELLSDLNRAVAGDRHD